jgi:hypothetical protein
MNCAICGFPAQDLSWLTWHMRQAHPLTTRVSTVETPVELTDHEKALLIAFTHNSPEYIEHYARLQG